MIWANSHKKESNQSSWIGSNIMKQWFLLYFRWEDPTRLYPNTFPCSNSRQLSYSWNIIINKTKRITYICLGMSINLSTTREMSILESHTRRTGGAFSIFVIFFLVKWDTIVLLECQCQSSHREVCLANHFIRNAAYSTCISRGWKEYNNPSRSSSTFTDSL